MPVIYPSQTAATSPVTPVGTISATDVQSAIEELDSEKVALDDDQYIAASYIAAVSMGALI